MAELSVEEKTALSDHRFQKSKEALSDADINFAGGIYKTSVNRSYYLNLAPKYTSPSIPGNVLIFSPQNTLNPMVS